MTTTIITGLLALGLIALAYVCWRLADRVEQVLSEARDYAAEVSLPAAQSASKAREEAGRARNGLEVFRISFEARMGELAKRVEPLERLADVDLTRLTATAAKCGEEVRSHTDQLSSLTQTVTTFGDWMTGQDDRVSGIDAQVAKLYGLNKTLTNAVKAANDYLDDQREALRSRCNDLDSRLSALEKPKARKARAKEAAE